MMAAIACAQHVLRLDVQHAAESRCNLVNLHQNEISSGDFIGYHTFDNGKFSAVFSIAESLKTHEVLELESDHLPT
jgi:hypothetical protein